MSETSPQTHLKEEVTLLHILTVSQDKEEASPKFNREDLNDRAIDIHREESKKS